MIVKRYKNGNFTAKRGPGEEFFEGSLIHLIWALQEKDCDIFGEEYCMGNALGMAVDMYDCYTDKLIRIPYSILDNLENGKTIRLYARSLDKYDRQQLAEMEAMNA